MTDYDNHLAQICRKRRSRFWRTEWTVLSVDAITLLHSNHKAWAAGQKCPLSLPPPFNIFSFSQLERLDGLFGRKGANSCMQILRNSIVKLLWAHWWHTVRFTMLFWTGDEKCAVVMWFYSGYILKNKLLTLSKITKHNNKPKTVRKWSEKYEAFSLTHRELQSSRLHSSQRRILFDLVRLLLQDVGISFSYREDCCEMYSESLWGVGCSLLPNCQTCLSLFAVK